MVPCMNVSGVSPFVGWPADILHPCTGQTDNDGASLGVEPFAPCHKLPTGTSAVEIAALHVGSDLKV
jgi:hypothetical protein